MFLLIAKHSGGLQTYACSHGNPNQGKHSSISNHAGTKLQSGLPKTSTMGTAWTSAPRSMVS
jgi:hypothetical protein